MPKKNGWLRVVKRMPYTIQDWWYQFKCWVWYRYRTVKPSSLKGHGWVDRDTLMLHCMFQCLVDFVEGEDPFNRTDFDHETVRHVKKEIQELYTWWKDVYLKDIYPQGGSTFHKSYDEVNRQCHRLIEIRSHLWT